MGDTSLEAFLRNKVINIWFSYCMLLELQNSKELLTSQSDLSLKNFTKDEFFGNIVFQ